MSDVDAVPSGGRVGRMLGVAALVAALVGAVIDLVIRFDPSAVAVAGLVIAYAALEELFGRMRSRPAIAPDASRVRWVVLDVLVVTAVLGGTGGLASPYVLYAGVVAVAAGASSGRLAGGVSGVTLALAAVLAFAFDDPTTFGRQPVLVVIAALVLVALGLLGGYEYDASGVDRGTLYRAYVNELLQELLQLAEQDTGAFDQREIGQRLAAQADALTEGEAIVLLGRGPHFVAAASSRRTAAPGVVVAREHLADGVVLPGSPMSLELDRAGISERFVTILPGACGAVVARGPVRDHDVLTHAARDLDNAEAFARVRDIAADRERRRMAADLHDGLAQVLAHLRFELDLIASGLLPEEDIRDQMTRLARVADRALVEARSTVTGLRASVIHEGLVGTLKSYVDDLSGLAGPGISFQASADPRLSPEVEQDVLRLVQEAVSNALRHADADRIEVKLTVEDGDVVVVVEDDGRGFRPRADVEDVGIARGLGMSSMRDRAGRIGGTLRVVTEPGEGTRLELRCPVEPPMGNADGEQVGRRRG